MQNPLGVTMNPKVKNLLNDWQTVNPDLYEIANSVRTRILQLAGAVDEEVKYGGILFLCTRQKY